ncbi:MAG TPA: tRNA(Ile2) 2-agmatinylcytidine synthetase [Methanoregulaceae archaeon]|jgi:methanogenesis imperfect marker protein 11|nr:tRNA(Ile2) 2-agmatinylcytidine synthetase [Methanoregulaceae archaeon]HOV67108.1 tRNA(Ile2) 2-agmatinylcytidine synthetase [Methanoregulaceae archaeon]HQJ88914.1 tRNA(Ile2) 2-agmatinylcytidine synthetase [Methanoregulaceae archaeon]
MITLTPQEVRAHFGSLFSEQFLVMVDQAAGVAEIRETCRARGPVEWDAMNRQRAGGAITSCSVDGSTLTIRTRIGRFPVRFGPAEAKSGGQALEAVEIEGDEVVTSWAGIAGAGVGVAACLPQAPGVSRAVYPSEADLRIGGARENRVRIYSPAFEKVVFGIDDTDTSSGGATWVLALQCAAANPIKDAHLLGMRLVQLNPAVPNKTTNCVGSALVYAVRPQHYPALERFVVDYICEHALSPDAGIAVRKGIVHPPAEEEMRRVKTEILTVDLADSMAKRLGVRFIDPNGGRGRIGALGALLWANEGAEAAGLDGEHL